MYKKLALVLSLALAGALYAQGYYDAQCMKLDFYGAHLTVDGVFCKRQMGIQLIDYKTLEDCIEDRARFELKQAERGGWMEG
jgi:hypothetical protein